jgi:predicted RNA methylase
VTTLDTRVREVLEAAEVDGVHLRLVGQLDRADYAKVNKVLEALGGKWNRKAAAHVFAADPREALATVLGSGVAPLHSRAAEGYVATPAELAEWIVSHYLNALRPGAEVLEPSAGDGAFVRAVVATKPGVLVTAIEPNGVRATAIVQSDTVSVGVTTLENFAATTTQSFHAVAMNPPFSLPDNRTVWIDHVRLAFELLKPGGRLVSIVPAGFKDRRDRRHAEIRELVAAHGGWDALPDDAFVSQGTGVRTVLLWLDKDSEVPA